MYYMSKINLEQINMLQNKNTTIEDVIIRIRLYIYR